MRELPPLTKQGRSIVSGSSQLTMSYDERYEGRASGTKTLLSASIQVNYEELAMLPTGIISSSEQFQRSSIGFNSSIRWN